MCMGALRDDGGGRCSAAAKRMTATLAVHHHRQQRKKGTSSSSFPVTFSADTDQTRTSSSRLARPFSTPRMYSARPVFERRRARISFCAAICASFQSSPFVGLKKSNIPIEIAVERAVVGGALRNAAVGPAAPATKAPPERAAAARAARNTRGDTDIMLHGSRRPSAGALCFFTVWQLPGLWLAYLGIPPMGGCKRSDPGRGGIFDAL